MNRFFASILICLIVCLFTENVFGTSAGPAVRKIGNGDKIHIHPTEYKYGIYPSSGHSKDLPFVGRSKPEYDFDSRIAYFRGELDTNHIVFAHLKEDNSETGIKTVFASEPAYYIYDTETKVLSDPLIESDFEQQTSRNVTSFDWKVLEYTDADRPNFTALFVVLVLTSLFFLSIPVIVLLILVFVIVKLTPKKKKQNPESIENKSD